jgi:hypothetical protein
MMSSAGEREPMPGVGDERVLPLVIEDLVKRSEMGKEKYNTYLETFNGRDALMDLYQELLDACMYLRQTITERRKMEQNGKDFMTELGLGGDMDEEPTIAVDLDGTLAQYHPGDWKGPLVIGPPIPLMKSKVERWIREGKKVKIWTARVARSLGPRVDGVQVEEIEGTIWNWLEENIKGWEKIVAVSAEKTYLDIELYDDRAHHILLNTGEERRARLQRENTKLVEENRDLKSQLMGAICHG